MGYRTRNDLVLLICNDLSVDKNIISKARFKKKVKEKLLSQMANI